jgi:hypothetical protein
LEAGGLTVAVCAPAHFGARLSQLGRYSATVIAPAVKEPPTFRERAAAADVRHVRVDRFDAPSILAGLVATYEAGGA